MHKAILVLFHIPINRPIGLFGGKHGALGYQSNGFANEGVNGLTTQLFVGIQGDEISFVSFSSSSAKPVGIFFRLGEPS